MESRKEEALAKFESQNEANVLKRSETLLKGIDQERFNK